MPWREHPDLRALRRTWYAKLRAHGFNDIEDVEKDMLKTWTASGWAPTVGGTNTRTQLTHSASRYSRAHAAAYYRMAGSFLHEHQFEKKWHKRVWRMHSQGQSYKTISEATGISNYRVKATVQRLKKVMLASKV